MEIVEIQRRFRFSASHVYRRADWTEEENRKHFGLCANLPGHGHNYRLFVSVTGQVDHKTGFLVNLVELDRIVHEAVVDRLDHQHLNGAVAEFREDQIPSCENLIAWIYRELHRSLPQGVRLSRLRLEEDEDLAAELTPVEG